MDKLDLVLEMLKEMSKRIDRIEHNIERLEDNQNRLADNQNRLADNQSEDRKMLMDIWKSRDKVTAQVTLDFIWKATAFNAVLLLFMLTVLKVL